MIQIERPDLVVAAVRRLTAATSSAR